MMFMVDRHGTKQPPPLAVRVRSGDGGHSTQEVVRLAPESAAATRKRLREERREQGALVERDGGESGGSRVRRPYDR